MRFVKGFLFLLLLLCSVSAAQIRSVPYFKAATLTDLAICEHDVLVFVESNQKFYYWSGAAWTQVAAGGAVVTSVATRTGDVVLTSTDVGLANVTNTSDVNKPVSTAQQTALNLKADLASPTFTGTVAGITKSMVGLSNVANLDTSTTANITDSLNKRFITDAQQTVLTNTSGTNTGDQTSISGNAATATTLQTPRTIAGVSFNGSANISIAASGLSNGTIGSGAVVLASTPTLTTPVIGAATGTSLAVSGALTSSSPTVGIGYATGAGGTVTQATSKATGVTLDKVCGTITMNAAALASVTIVTFTVTDAAVGANDVIVVQHDSGGTIGSYTLAANSSAAGSFKISVRNNTAASLSEAIVIRFVIIKAVVS